MPAPRLEGPAGHQEGERAQRRAAKLRAACTGYANDARRRAVNEDRVQDDLTGGYVLAALWLGVASKTWRGGEAGLALLPASYALHELSHSVLVRLWPAYRCTYVRWREPLVLALVLHNTAILITLSLWSQSSLLQLHAGSPLRVALVLAAANGSLAHSTYYPFCGFLRPFVAAALPLTLLLPLASSRGLCHRLLEDTTAHEPLTTLFSIISTAHSAVASPFGWPEFPPTGAGVPLQPCIQVNLYLICMLGCALPLLLARPLLPQQQQQSAQQQQGLPRGAQQEQTGQAVPVCRAVTCWLHLLMRLALASSVAWSLGTVAALLFGSCCTASCDC